MTVECFHINKKINTKEMGLYEKSSRGSSRSLPSMSSFVDKFDDDVPRQNKIKMKKYSRSRRCRRRLAQLLKTHVILISVCVLSALDASCVLGQIICDILIMTEAQHEFENVETLAVKEFTQKCGVLQTHVNATTAPTLKELVEEMESYEACSDQVKDNGDGGHGHHLYNLFLTGNGNAANTENHARKKRAANADDGHSHGDHSLTHEITHAFHLGSMIILSILVLETVLKIFGAGRKFLHHKLEVFDAFVIIVSWALDVAFWEGIWAHPGTEAATILIIILPWRVVRIVNSFVLVIEEKDLVQLKVVKQQYRRTLKRAKIIRNKMDMYKVESRQLQGLCRKYGISEPQIVSCAPLVKQRRRSSMGAAFSSFASLAMITSVGSQPELDKDSSSEDESAVNDEIKRNEKAIFRSMSVGSELSSTVSFTLSPDSVGASSPDSQKVFSFDDLPPTYDEIKPGDLEAGLYTRL